MARQVIVARYIDETKLLNFLAGRFPGQSYQTEVSLTHTGHSLKLSVAVVWADLTNLQIRLGKWIIFTPEPLTQVCPPRFFPILFMDC